MAASKSPPAVVVCASCKEPIGEKVAPVSIPEDSGDGKGKMETFCPACFCSVRAPQDPRWAQASRLGRLFAVKCAKCGWTSLAMGRRACGQCHSPSVVNVLPKGAVLKPGQLKPVTRLG